MLLFVTNREIIASNFKEVKSGEKMLRVPQIEVIREDGEENAGDNLRFGTYDLKTKKFNLFPEPYLEEHLMYTAGGSGKVPAFGSNAFFHAAYEEFKATTGKIPGKSDVLFFIHGFNNDLKQVRDTFEKLHQQYVLPKESSIAHVIIFTWPGMNKSIPYHYFDDRKDAVRSGLALYRGMGLFRKFLTSFLVKAGNPDCNTRIHLMAHSMGNRVLKETMLEYERRNEAVPQIFNQIISIAADVHWDSFDQGEGFDRLSDFGEEVHVVFHRKDRILDISKLTKNLSNRLGRYGRKRKEESYKTIFDHDVTELDEDQGTKLEELGNHWYYYSSNKIVVFLQGVLKRSLLK